MFETLGDWRVRIEAMALYCLLVAAIVLSGAVPAFKDDPTTIIGYSLETKLPVYQQVLSETFVFALVLAGVAAIMYLATRGSEKVVPRRRSIVEVWQDIPEVEKSKMGLSQSLDKRFIEDGLYNYDATYSILRTPLYVAGKYRYLVLDMLDDWKRRATTPIFTFDVSNMGIERAKSILPKKAEPFSRFITEAEKLGLNAEEFQRKLAERRLEAERSQRELPVGGPENATG